LNFPARFGGAYEPGKASTPCRPSPSSTARANGTALSQSSGTPTLRSRATSDAGLTSSFFATAVKMAPRSRSAAWMAAMPHMSVTRDE
jgi:hypothetical protein